MHCRFVWIICESCEERCCASINNSDVINPITGNVWRCLKSAGGGSIRPPPHISNVSQERGLKFLHNIPMYINYICANFQRNICIMTIKIDQNKFNHYNPLAEMTGSTVKSGNSN